MSLIEVSNQFGLEGSTDAHNTWQLRLESKLECLEKRISTLEEKVTPVQKKSSLSPGNRLNVTEVEANHSTFSKGINLIRFNKTGRYQFIWLIFCFILYVSLG